MGFTSFTEPNGDQVIIYLSPASRAIEVRCRHQAAAHRCMACSECIENLHAAQVLVMNSIPRDLGTVRNLLAAALGSASAPGAGTSAPSSSSAGQVQL